MLATLLGAWLLVTPACGEYELDDTVAVSLGSGRAHLQWSEYRDLAIHLDSRPGFVVDGDVYVDSEDELYERYLRTQEDPRALTVDLVGGNPNVWSDNEGRSLTYCIDQSFDTDSDPNTSVSAIQTALVAAAEDWRRLVDVDFIHLTNEDGNCTSSNTNVVFNVVNTNTTRFFAASFFPDDSRAGRQLEVAPAAFTTTAGGRDLQGIITHELGHALGFRHEHIWLVPACTAEGTTDAQLVTTYDVDSVMHYPQCRPSGTGGYRVTGLDEAGAVALYGLQPALYPALFAAL
jgi:predicted Zn-dependent protease